MNDSVEKTEKDFFMKYLDQRFDNLHLQLNTIDKKQSETDISVKGLTNIIDTIKLQYENKFTYCANSSELKELNKRVDEVYFIKKYYKPFLVTAAVSIGIMFYTVTEGYFKLRGYLVEKSSITENDKENCSNDINKDSSSRETDYKSKKDYNVR